MSILTPATIDLPGPARDVLAVLRSFGCWMDESALSQALLDQGKPLDRQSLLKFLAVLVSKNEIRQDRVRGVRIYQII